MADQPTNQPSRGGNELPPELTDRPEQNRGYDEAVRGQEAADLPPGPQDALARDAEEASPDIDEREARAASDEVRQRDHSADRKADPGFRTKGG